jgi:hypothetical protein
VNSPQIRFFSFAIFFNALQLRAKVLALRQLADFLRADKSLMSQQLLFAGSNMLNYLTCVCACVLPLPTFGIPPAAP